MSEIFSRTKMLLGEEALDKLSQARVIVFGVGGVGGYVVEALARSGVGHIELVDKDVVDETNINRQIIALHSTIGRYKTEVMKERILDINPSAEVITHNVFYLPSRGDDPGTAKDFDFTRYDYIIDAVDTVTAKLTIIEEAYRCRVPIISSMGAGNKIDPTRFQVADIYKTSVCPLAKVMRRELKKRGIKKLKCVYSTEDVQTTVKEISGINKDEQIVQDKEIKSEPGRKKIAPGSIAFVPSVAGLIIAGEVVKDLCNSNYSGDINSDKGR